VVRSPAKQEHGQASSTKKEGEKEKSQEKGVHKEEVIQVERGRRSAHFGIREGKGILWGEGERNYFPGKERQMIKDTRTK